MTLTDEPTQLEDMPPLDTVTPTQADMLQRIREPFPADQIGKLPRVTCGDCRQSRVKQCDRHKKAKCNDCGAWITPAHIHLDYVGHAELTDRLLTIDPLWTWEPMAFDDDGLPKYRKVDSQVELWVRFTFAGVTRPGVGTADDGKNELGKELIGDALRNAAMRFGAALNLWAKSELPVHDSTPEPDPPAAPEPTITPAQVAQIVKLFNNVPDEHRDAAKAKWKAAYVADPNQLLVKDFEQALAFAETAAQAPQ